MKNEPERKKISTLPKGLQEILNGNPFFIFGVPCNASESDAKVVIQKLKPLQAMKCSSDYRPRIDLAGVEKPDRDPSSVSMALAELKSSDYCWLWFLDDTYCGYHNGRVYNADNWMSRDILDGFVDYDQFLASYYNLLLNDPELKNTFRWEVLLKGMQSFVISSQNDGSIFLRSRVSSEDSRTTEELLTSFQRAIYRPIEAAVQSLSPVQACRLLNLRVWTVKDSLLPQSVQGLITDVAIGWIDDAVKPLEEVNRAVTHNQHDVTEEESELILEALQSFEARYWPAFKEVEENLPSGSPHIERIRQKVGNIINYLRVKIFDRKVLDSAHFYSLIYPYIVDRLVREGSWKAYSLEGYEPYMVDVSPKFLSKDQLITKAEQVYAPEDASCAIDCCKELIRNNFAVGYMGLFQYYVDQEKYMAAKKALDSAHKWTLSHAETYVIGICVQTSALYLHAYYKGIISDFSYWEELNSQKKDDDMLNSYHRIRTILEFSRSQGTELLSYANKSFHSDEAFTKAQSFILYQMALDNGENTYRQLAACYTQSGYGVFPSWYKRNQILLLGVQNDDAASMAQYGWDLYNGNYRLPRDTGQGLQLLLKVKESGLGAADEYLSAIQNQKEKRAVL